MGAPDMMIASLKSCGTLSVETEIAEVFFFLTRLAPPSRVGLERLCGVATMEGRRDAVPGRLRLSACL